MSAPAAIFFWRKVDSPGHDSCRLLEWKGGYRLIGSAVFLEKQHVCQLHYDVVADAAFRTRSAAVAGFIDRKAVDLRVRSRPGQRWQVNGTEVPALAGPSDVDLGFTPATNLLAIRRLGLAVGQEAEAPAVYLVFPRMQFRILSQRYKRISRSEYDYESPEFGYRGTLRVSPRGAIIDYPGLFQAVRS